jgi:hypothetical protein
MSLSTSKVETGGGYVPKNIQPGNVKAKLYKIELDQPDWLKKKDGYHLMLNLETEKPSDDFEGFNIIWDDPNSGKFEGQTGRVKANKWGFSDFKNKTVDINRDLEIMKFIKHLCEAFDCMDWWAGADNKFDTIEDFVKAFNDDAPFKDIYINWCIGGREYTKQSGYKGYDLSLPKFAKSGIPFEALDAKNSRLAKYDEDEHLEISEPAPVDDFGNDDDDSQDEFPEMEDAPEFEL